MNNGLLLTIGAITVLIGIYLLIREERVESSHYELDQIFNLMNSFDTKVHLALKTIDDKTNECLEKIKEAESHIGAKSESVSKKEQKTTPLSKIKLKHIDVYNLYIKGLSCKDIAISLNKGVGEIETIISLFKLEGD